MTTMSSLNSIWLKSYLSLFPLLGYVAAQEIWINSITGHMWVTICTIQWLWRLRNYKNVTNLLCMLRRIRLTEKGHFRIYHVNLYSWHKVTYMWPEMGFPHISHATIVSERSNFNQIVFVLYQHTDWVLLYSPTKTTVYGQIFQTFLSILHISHIN